MLRILIVGYVFAVRSGRQLYSELQVDMAYRWFCRRSLKSRITDHSVFSRAPHERFREADLLCRLFETLDEADIASGLVGGVET